MLMVANAGLRAGTERRGGRATCSALPRERTLCYITNSLLLEQIALGPGRRPSAAESVGASAGAGRLAGPGRGSLSRLKRVQTPWLLGPRSVRGASLVMSGSASDVNLAMAGMSTARRYTFTAVIGGRTWTHT